MKEKEKVNEMFFKVEGAAFIQVGVHNPKIIDIKRTFKPGTTEEEKQEVLKEAIKIMGYKVIEVIHNNPDVLKVSYVERGAILKDETPEE